MSVPFLKWAGGKRYLLPELIKRLPSKINTYYEPMVGGGALFFELANLKKFKKAKLSDINKELITTYQAIRDDVKKVISYLKQLESNHKTKNAENYFYKVRELNPEDLDNVQMAARLIYLNKTCFNGLYRVNTSGKFNTPYGHYKNPTICNEELLLKTSDILQNVTLTVEDFEVAVENAKTIDTIYFDPPYWPINKDSFIAYVARGFDGLDQERLANLVRKLKKKKIFTLLSNSDVHAVRTLYKGLQIDKVQVPRRINSKGTGRGKVNEVIISTGVNK